MNKGKLRNTARFVLCTLLALVCLLALSSCRGEEDTQSDTPHVLAYADVNISEYVRLGEYRGLTVTVADGQTEEEAIWSAVYASSEVLGYPEAQVDYYYSQSKARCEYYASLNGVSYGEAMTALGVSEESMLDDARELVAADMIEAALRADAGIELTEEEKKKYFDKYAEKYAYDWGYNLAYVEDELSEQVYSSMLYDKTTEYLLKNNTFISAQ